MIVEAGGRFSFADAAFALQLAGVSISPRHLRHLTVLSGDELAAAREAQAVAHRRRQLEPDGDPPAPAVVAAVAVDGGRRRPRAPGCGPGVQQAQRKQDKIACLVSLPSDTHAHDPQPEPPPSFPEPRRVPRRVQHRKGLSGEQPAAADAEADAPRSAPPPRRPAAKPRPGRARTGLASLHDSRSFGPRLAAAAQRRGFYQAGRRAFLGEGPAYHGASHKGYLADVEPIVAFRHVLG
jgi:hypothetical protein